MRRYKSLYYWTKMQTFHFSRFSMKVQTLVFLFASHDYAGRKCDSVERSKLKEGETRVIRIQLWRSLVPC